MQKDSYNRGGYLAFLFSMVFSLAFFVYISVIHPGIDLKEVKPVEGGPTQTLAGGGAPSVDISKIEKPWAENEDMATHGKKVYANNCAVCHGNGGAGDGPAGMSLIPKPRNLVEGGWKKGGTSMALFKTVTEGLPGTSMAAFGHIPLADRWALVQFIRSITKDKPADDAAALENFAKTAK